METLTEASILASLQNKPVKPVKPVKPAVKPPIKPPIKPPVKVPVKLPADNNNIQSVDSSTGVEEEDPDAMLPPPKVERITSKVLETVIERAEEPSQSGSNGEITTNTQKLTEHVQLRRRISSESTSDADTETSIFAGLLRGSTPGGPRNVVSQICESDVVRQIKTKRQSTPSSFLSFDPVMEKEEDKDNIDADAVLAGLDDALKNNAAAENTNGHKSGDDGNIDESEEWANIAATLAEFGVGMARESVFVREYEADFARLLAGTHLAPKSQKPSNKIQSVGEWLEMLGLGQYENTLVANGFDDTDFLGGNVMEEQDLESIGITDTEHRTKLLKAANSLPKLEPIDQAKLPPSVEEWLKSLRLEQYLDTFNNHKYNTMERVVKVWELELTSVLDITSIGHRKRILASLGDRPAPERINSSSSPNIIKKTLTQGVEVISPFDHIDLYKDYTGVKSTAVDDPEVPEPSQNPLLMFGTGNDGLSQGQHIRDSTIHIRPPHLAHTTGSVRQWRHRPEILIKGCCNYTAQYLGSTLVKELNGPESTQEGISKLKQRLRRKLQKSTDVIAKIPTIMLSISYRGVKFIDAKSKKVICDHEIANIFCACQDSEHLNFFAYITKDRETQKHYCHVFSVRSRELAGEIILTLGEAFEIAYQMALKEKAEEDAMEFEKKLSPSDQEDTTSASSKASLNTV
ncbi:ankyrin repeat and SAM domain-containing protein 1A-like isoform X2 [Haliotis rubra]|uniref:ankyrin repeat and SAM domain-containing protein 1A-like isoform X2 n=1 Tax=Haliotis rubra TaxID=36100 RepID=UPI001EE4F0A7|nr:ankyrin repeat and SAM domain-containing protein 1A-like isoform X2 [Haliotis rubra]